MRSSHKTTPSLERDLRTLLGCLCTEWGFCIPPADADRIATSASLSANDFAVAVLSAEGMNAEHELQWRRRITQRFEGIFGASVAAEAYEAGAATRSP